MTQIDDSILNLPGVGKETAHKLNSLGINTVSDLFDYWPRRHEDYSKIITISNIEPGNVTLVGSFSKIKTRYTKKGLHLTEALLTDESGSVNVCWFNQFYRSKTIQHNKRYYVSGNYDLNSGSLSLVNPSILEYNDQNRNNLIFSVYSENKMVNSKLINNILKKCKHLFQYIEESLPQIVVDGEGLISRGRAIEAFHFPKSLDDLNQAKYRLAFEELFQIQLASELLKRKIENDLSPEIHIDIDFVKNIVSKLDFKLTDDQRMVLWKILQDMQNQHPMNRLIEGDVGSGKTIIALVSSLMAIKNNYQVLLMAPTEILAKQHGKTFKDMFLKTNYKDQVSILLGSMKKTEKMRIRELIKTQKTKMIIGTHALLEDAVTSENVGLVIIDEQHRFGVNQRQKLKNKNGSFPHFLSMTATPIPRTLALTLYGELDISIIKSKPLNRKSTVTKIIPFESRHGLYKKISEHIEEGNQVYIVCPLIDDSDKLQVSSVLKLYEEIKQKQLQKHNIAVLHGKMKSKEKDETMDLFREGKIDVLVSTTVIEVGVDVPDANIIVIEGAERFGLAQVHQLRGRVGRSGKQGFCYLLPSQDVGETRRLRALESTNDGFKLAEMDLELRGPGSIYGIRQSGLLDMRIANLSDKTLISRTRKSVQMFLNSGDNVLKYNELKERVKHFQSLTKLN